MTDKPVVPATEKLRRIYDALAESIDDTPGEELFEEMTPEDHQKCAELKEWALKTVRKYKPQPSPGIEAEKLTKRLEEIALKVWREEGWGEELHCAEGALCRASVKAGYEAAKSTSVEAATMKAREWLVERFPEEYTEKHRTLRSAQNAASHEAYAQYKGATGEANER